MTECCMTVNSVREIAKDIYELWLTADEWENVHAGQFLNLQVPSADKILKRPLGICDFDHAGKRLCVCFQVAGEGTALLARAVPGVRLKATYPLGNGFALNGEHQRVVLLGGGVGVFPLLPLLKEYPDRKFYAFLGYRSKEYVCLAERFEEKAHQVYLCTDDGSQGAKGFVTDSLRHHIEKIKPDLVLACGPSVMFRSLKTVMAKYPEIPVKISVEQRMGCGVGACLVCTCKIAGSDGVHNKRVCKDGPVFDLNEVVL